MLQIIYFSEKKEFFAIHLMVKLQNCFLFKFQFDQKAILSSIFT